MYGAFLENDSAKDCHVPSKDSIRDKDMPTCITYQKMFGKVCYRVVILNNIHKTEKKSLSKGAKGILEFVKQKYQYKGQTHIFKASSLIAIPQPAAINNQK